jgi:hypothetical protein
MVFGSSFGMCFAFVDLAVTAKIRHDREVASATIDFAGECCDGVSSCDYVDRRTFKYLRFSPVWLYMWVCSELGLVNLLSQTLHLCFFCVLDEILEENCPIIDCGAGGTPPFRRLDGLGSVREDTDSISEPAFE